MPEASGDVSRGCAGGGNAARLVLRGGSLQQTAFTAFSSKLDNFAAFALAA